MRRRVAVIFQLVAGVFGIYLVGRLIMSRWVRGFAELALGIAIILVLWPMLYVPFLDTTPYSRWYRKS